MVSMSGRKAVYPFKEKGGVKYFKEINIQMKHTQTLTKGNEVGNEVQRDHLPWRFGQVHLPL